MIRLLLRLMVLLRKMGSEVKARIISPSAAARISPRREPSPATAPTLSRLLVIPRAAGTNLSSSTSTASLVRCGALRALRIERRRGWYSDESQDLNDMEDLQIA